MSDMNCVALSGRLTRDVVVREVGDNKVANSTLAVDGRKEGEVTFVDVAFWGQLADFVEKWGKKGKPFFVKGRLLQEKWTNKEGENRSKISVVAESVEFVPYGSGDSVAKEEKPEVDEFGEDAPF